jgi:hypothetical protein
VIKKKFNESTFLKRLSKLPKQDLFDHHYWADYIELKCLVNQDGVFSTSDFLDDYKQRTNDLNEGKGTKRDKDEFLDSSFRDVPKSDKNLIFTKNCFRLFPSRIVIFKKYYPFQLSGDQKTLILRPNLTLKHKHYLFLLFSSALRYTLDFKSELTSSFELFSLRILEQLMPETAQVHLFGSSNSLIKNKRYIGSMWEKVVKLSEDLNEGTPKAKKNDFPNNDNGDGGLDFIGWISNGDNHPHLITYTGQAACTEDWDYKQFSSSYEAWKNKIPFSVRPINIVFVPHCLRDADGSWHRRSDIGDCLLLDRQRLLHHFRNDGKYFEKLPSFKAVNELIKQKESVFN